MQVIIYQKDAGGISVIYPMPETIEIYGIDAIATKDVPAGKPYKIVDSADIPTDRTLRSNWTVDEADLTDGVGSESNEFPVNEEQP